VRLRAAAADRIRGRSQVPAVKAVGAEEHAHTGFEEIRLTILGGGGQCYDHNFLRFSPIFRGKMGVFFLKNSVFGKTSIILNKKGQFIRQFLLAFCESRLIFFQNVSI
jgi:hypothetical protein